MKYREVKKLLLTASVVSAVALTACNNKEVAEEPAEVVEEDVEETTAVEEVAEEVVEEEVAEVGIEETYTIKFEGTSLDDITANTQELVTIPQYQAPHFIDAFEGQTCNSEFFAENFEVVEEKADGRIVAKPLSYDLTLGMSTQYSYDESTGAMKAIFVFNSVLVGEETQEAPENLGLYFVLSQNENGEYFVSGLEDFAGNDVSNIELFQGICIGYSLTNLASESVDFSFGDELYLSQDLDLFPVFNIIDGINNPYELLDFSDGKGYIWSYGGGIILIDGEASLQKIADAYGTQSSTLYWTVKNGGRLISDDNTKEYDVKTKKVIDYKPTTTDASDKGDSSKVTPKKKNANDSNDGRGNSANSGVVSTGQTTMNFDTPSAEFLALPDLTTGKTAEEMAAQTAANGWGSMPQF